MKKVYQYLPNGILHDMHSSQQLAADSIGMSELAIRKHIKNGKELKGFIWSNDEIIKFSPPIGTETNMPTYPKVLILDVETAPLLSYTFGVWKQNISMQNIISEWYILCWAGKWLGEDEVFSDSLNSEEARSENDKRIMQHLWDKIDEADVLIAHNGNKFDIPKINTRFLVNGLNPPSPYRQVDTLEIARKQFAFTHNKLDAINKFLGLQRKLDTDFELWKDCVAGKRSALLQMEIYCQQDINCLEEAYLKLRPFAKGLPNLDTYIDEKLPACTVCGSTNVHPVVGKSFYTQSSKFQLYRCQDCKGMSRAKRADKFEFKKQLSSIPK